MRSTQTPQKIFGTTGAPFAPRATRTPRIYSRDSIPFHLPNLVVVVPDMATIRPSVYSGYTLVTGPDTEQYRDILKKLGGIHPKYQGGAGWKVPRRSVASTEALVTELMGAGAEIKVMAAIDFVQKK